MVRNSFRDRKEGYTDKAVVIRFGSISTHVCLHVYNKVLLIYSVITHDLVLVIIVSVLVCEMHILKREQHWGQGVPCTIPNY